MLGEQRLRVGIRSSLAAGFAPRRAGQQDGSLLPRAEEFLGALVQGRHLVLEHAMLRVEGRVADELLVARGLQKRGAVGRNRVRLQSLNTEVRKFHCEHTK